MICCNCGKESKTKIFTDKCPHCGFINTLEAKEEKREIELHKKEVEEIKSLFNPSVINSDFTGPGYIILFENLEHNYLLCADKLTNVVYILERSAYGFKSLCPFYSMYGKLCRYNHKTEKIEEIV